MVILLGPCQKFPCDVLVRSVNEELEEVCCEDETRNCKSFDHPTFFDTHTHTYTLYIHTRSVFWSAFLATGGGQRTCFQEGLALLGASVVRPEKYNAKFLPQEYSLLHKPLVTETKRCWRDGRSQVHAYGGEQKSSKSRLGH